MSVPSSIRVRWKAENKDEQDALAKFGEWWTAMEVDLRNDGPIGLNVDPVYWLYAKTLVRSEQFARVKGVGLEQDCRWIRNRQIVEQQNVAAVSEKVAASTSPKASGKRVPPVKERDASA